ncbi:MAG: hypothetical protein J5I94_29330 [Phaeodactylibacter sp.]|nr:hypothetical protein [Phaeodactylibacter sp.]
MKKEELKKLTDDELKKKEQGVKTIIGLFIPILLGLLYFGLRGYARGEGADIPVLIIALSSLGSLFAVWPGLKAIREERKAREI